MPDTLQHIRHTAEQATDPNAFTPHACVEMDEKGAFWLLALLPIVERIAERDPIIHIEAVFDSGDDVHVCGFCGRLQGDAPYRHYEGCLYLAALALKGGQ